MINYDKERAIYIKVDHRKLSIIVFSLFFSWVLAFPFQGQILYSLAREFDFLPDTMVFSAIVFHFIGLFFCGFFIKSMKAAKQLILTSIIFCILASSVFFFPPSFLWITGLLSSSTLAGASLAAWGFYFKYSTSENHRIKTAADGLIYSNILMIFLNMVAIHLSPRIGLGLAMFMLLFAFLFALWLPKNTKEIHSPYSKKKNSRIGIVKPLSFLYLFIVIITINSGLMYQVINPSYSNIEWLTSWYWAIPYIIALIFMRNLSQKTNRAYILYIGIAMIGFSVIAFMNLNSSAYSYLVVDTLMLGACGIYDLFWWSILGEMLDFHNNPAKIFGIGISSNVLGVLLGSLIGKALLSSEVQFTSSITLALIVVCLTFAILPLLHRTLSSLLKDHVYLSNFTPMSIIKQDQTTDKFIRFENLSDRESQVASLLLQRKTYKMIAEELFISENTVKYYVKNIYSKFHVQSRSQLIDIISKKPLPEKR